MCEQWLRAWCTPAGCAWSTTPPVAHRQPWRSAMRLDRTELFDAERLQEWFRPDLSTVKVEFHDRFQRRCAALTAVLTGAMSLTRAAEANGLCRRRLKRMTKLAPQLARDGHPLGYRVCVPWGTYEGGDDDTADAQMP